MKKLRAVFFGQNSQDCGNSLQTGPVFRRSDNLERKTVRAHSCGRGRTPPRPQRFTARTWQEQVFLPQSHTPLSGVPQRDPGNCSLTTGCNKTPGIKDRLRAGDVGATRKQEVTQEVNFAYLYVLGKVIHTQRETFELLKIIL